MAEIAEASPRPARLLLARVMWLVVLPLVVVVALLLPPFSLYERVAFAGFTSVGSAGGTVADGNGAALTIAPGALIARSHVRLQPLESLPADATAALPDNVGPVGTVYAIDVRSDVPGHATLRLPLGANAGPRATIDLYAWDGTQWSWVPHRFDGSSVLADLRGLPQSVALIQTGPVSPAVAVTLSEDASLTETTDAVSAVNPIGLYVKDDGSLGGSLVLPDLSGLSDGLLVAPVITNRVGGVIRSDWVDNLLIDEAAWRRHAGTVAARVIEKGYDGVVIDYRGVDPQLRELFTAFIRHLGDRLHAENKRLTVVLDMPKQTASGWDTGAYDWPAIGQAADRVRILLTAEPAAFADGRAVDSLLSYAVTQVDRRKIQPVLSMAGRDVVGDQVTNISYRDALTRLTEVEVSAAGPVLVGETVRIDLPALAASGGIRFDETTGAYWFAYSDNAGRPHKVWLEDAGSLARKLEFVSRWHLGGVALRDASQSDVDPRVWETLTEFEASGAAQAAASDFSVIWTVPGGSGTEQVVQPISATSLEWTAPKDPGVYQIQVSLSSDGGQSPMVDPGESVAVEVQAPTPTPTPLPPTPAPTPTPAADALVQAKRLNVREGPSTNYKIINDVAAGDELTVTGKNEDGTWLQIETDDIEKGWVFADLVETLIDLEGVAVAEAPPEPTPAPRQNFQAVSVAPRSGVGFGYGVQAHMIGENLTPIFDQINGMGFNWVKQQVEWFRIEPEKGKYAWGILDPIVDTANARGVNVLFSVVKAPHWARPGNADFSVEGPPANPQDFANFMGAMAAHYRGRVRAYEIWNEQNLHYEWGNEPLDAGRYVQLLAAAYNAIKANDPSAVVVSGALTPTGVNDGRLAVDDAVYLERMYQAGLARVCDAIGAHPSGYNNPPNVSFTNWSDPSAAFGAKGHRSWFFYDTMVTYRNIMNKYGDSGKRIWPTEFGWASVEGLGVAPVAGYEYAADNTEAEQAQFLVQAFQLARSWGWVGPMFVWNLNFGPISGAHDEKAAFGILRPDWSPRPAYSALRDMPK